MQTAVKTHGIFINGEWRDAPNGKSFTVKNPATGEVVQHVADGGVAEARQAVEAASAAFPAWAATTADKRAALLTKAANLMTERTEHLAKVLTEENGKPLAETRGEVTIGPGCFHWNAQA